MDLAIKARQFLRTAHHGILSTHSAKFAGYPFGSVTPFMLDHDCQPAILISSIAEHTKNIIYNPKVSLVVFEKNQTNLQSFANFCSFGKTNLVMMNTSPSSQTECFSVNLSTQNIDNLARVERFVLLNSTITRMTVYVWN